MRRAGAGARKSQQRVARYQFADTVRAVAHRMCAARTKTRWYPPTITFPQSREPGLAYAPGGRAAPAVSGPTAVATPARATAVPMSTRALMVLAAP